MKARFKNISSGLFACLMVSMAGMSARADDTEIFFTGSSDSGGVQPNILFVLDNSGSMDERDCPVQVPALTAAQCTANYKTRMERLQDAMDSLLTGLENVNVGLMQYSMPGAAVLYPVKSISGEFTAPQVLTYPVSVGANDAEQASGGTVTLTRKTLALGHRLSDTEGSVEKRVTASTDDTEELVSTGAINVISSASLEVVFDDFTPTADKEHAIGTIFRGLSIPAGAVIRDAYVQFTVQADSGSNLMDEPLKLQVTGQTGTPIATFSNITNIATRPRTSATKTWNINDPSPATGTTLNTPDISAIVQEIVNQGSWVSGSDMALFFQRPASDTSDGIRHLASYDASSGTTAPKLVVMYESPATDTTQTVGLRFEGVKIPSKATITSASLEFVAAANNSSTALYSIYGEKAANSSALTTASSNLTGRALTAASESWTPGAWSAGETYSTLDQNKDLKAIVQEIVNQSGWCGGNALSFLLSGSGSRLALSGDYSSSLAPKLKVTYDPSAIPTDGGCMTTELSYRIPTSNGSDDAISTPTRTGDTTLILGQDGSTSKTTGFRFSNIGIEKNADIVNAYLEFTAAATTTTAASLTIKVQGSDNPNTNDTNRNEPRDRTFLSSPSQTWSLTSGWTQGTTYRSDDIEPLVQTIVNRSGWDIGNAIYFGITGTGTRTVHAAESSSGATAAARLIIRVKSTQKAVAATNREALISAVRNMRPLTNTPIVDALYEAALYYRGDAIAWGDQRTHRTNLDSEIARYLRVSSPDSYTGGTAEDPAGCTASDLDSVNCVGQRITGSPEYTSPIVSECQSNHIVFLTDGEPTDNQSESLVRSMTGDTSCAAGPTSAWYTNTRTGSTTDYTKCGPELTSYLYNNDQSTDVDGKQNIQTHTVAFNLANGSEYLDSLSKNDSNSGAYSAASTADLVGELEKIVGNIVIGNDTTFVSPGVTVNTFNRLTHRNEIYYALFRPLAKPSWPGNLKRYAITSDGTILSKPNGTPVIDEATGTFKKDAKSYWVELNNRAADGNDVTKGGAAAELPLDSSRKVFTHHSTSSSTTLTATDNLLLDSNTEITTAMLGVADATARSNVIKWARGLDPATSTERNQLGDPLHSVPHLVTYGGTDEAPDIAIFYGDNEGFIHAINAENGQEHFAFIPEVLLRNLAILQRDSTSDDHPYGMDGPINSWTYDVDGDSQIESADGDKVTIYAGMRRGGRNYYALDVTDLTSPKLKWTILGGSGDFTELGETWSKPVKTKINVSGTIKDVLIFGGGYDPDQEDTTVITADDVGRAVFIVDASTGTKIWSAGPTSTHNLRVTDMNYSIPSNIRVLDTNNDGLTDQMYVGDVGGQLWRFDITNGNSVSQLATGAVIADISGTTESSARRFYHEPDVSVIVENNRRKLAIAIGSGFQAHPLDDAVVDRIYLFKQADVLSAPKDGSDSGNDPDYVKLTESNLYDATNNLIGEGSTSQQATALADLASKSGWYITLEDTGEKVLSTPLAVSGELFITTYSPSTNIVGCVRSNGTARLYRVSTLDATPTNNTDETVALTKDDRTETLKTIGLPPDPVRLRISDDAGTQDVLCVGTECQAIGGDRALIKTYWYSE